MKGEPFFKFRSVSRNGRSVSPNGRSASPNGHSKTRNGDFNYPADYTLRFYSPQIHPFSSGFGSSPDPGLPIGIVSVDPDAPGDAAIIPTVSIATTLIRGF